MNSNKNNAVNDITIKIKKLLNNRNIPVFFLFFLIATLLWFLNTLNKEYTTEIQIPIRYSNIPEEKLLSQDYTRSVRVIFSGHGYNILRIKLERFNIPIQVNLNRHRLNQTSYNPYKYYLLSDNLHSNVGRRLGKDINIVSVSPDTLFFNYTPVSSKKVPVKLNVDYEIPKEFMVMGKVEVIPDSVTVYGEEKTLKEIDYMETVFKYFGKTDKSIDEKIKMKKIQGVRLDVKEIRLKVAITKFIDDNIEINIEKVNFPAGTGVRLIPNKAIVSYRVPIDHYQNLNKNSFTVVADYNKRENNYIVIDTRSSDKKVKILRTQPSAVYFLLER